MADEHASQAAMDEQAALPLTIITLPPEPAAVILPEDAARQAPRMRTVAETRRGWLRWISALAIGAVTIATILSVTPLAQVASPILPWEAQQQVAAIPSPTPARPYVVGVHPFICAALPFARRAQNLITEGGRAQRHPWYVSVILAQWGIEQGWQMPGYTGYNFGNVSAIAGQPYVPGTGTAGSPVDFAYAPTADQGVADYVLFVQNGRYTAVADAYPAGPIAQATALGESPWDAAHYTGTGHPGSSLVGVIQQYDLQRFDDPAATC